MFQKKCVQKIKTHILCSIIFSLKNHTVYEKCDSGFSCFFQSFQAHTGIVPPIDHDLDIVGTVYHLVIYIRSPTRYTIWS